MLFNASPTYAPGQPHGDVSGSSGGQNVDVFGRYNLAGLGGANLWVGVAGLLVLLWLIHRQLR